MTKTFAFFGASGGCGHASLLSALAAGHTCIALCRDPSKLQDLTKKYPSNLIINPGNAHSVDDVASCLKHEGKLVDAVNFSIGAKPDSKGNFSDPNVCYKGMTCVLEALGKLRCQGLEGRPLLSIVSTTGITSVTRDVPLVLVPFYHLLLATPHKDKKVTEELVCKSKERFVLVRPSLLVDGDDDSKEVRVGLEDPKTGTLERKAVGYTISRGAVGRWMFEGILNKAPECEYERKAVSLTW